MSESETGSGHTPRRKKKGIKRPNEYKSEVIKKARVKGVEYINWKGKNVPAILPPLSKNCKCTKKCLSIFANDEKYQIFQQFRELNTKNEQDCYLQGLISVSKVKQRRRRKTVEESSKPNRSNTYIYSISTPNKKIIVCKIAFCYLYGITVERVRRLCFLVSAGKSPIDKRGKCTPGNAIPGIVTDAIHEHIKSYPTKLAHYTTKEKLYLNEKLDITTMHNMFLQKYAKYGTVKYSYYRKVFKEDFDLSFGRPQVDTCCTCEELSMKIQSKVLNDTAKRVAAAEKIVHLRQAKKFSEHMKVIAEMTKSNEEVGAITIDYMQNLQLPHIPVQEVFYLRQLTVNVFCIHDLKNGQATFFLYHEGNGTKGPNEVCSFLMRYFMENMKSVKYLHVFSDGCGAQNKNHTILRLFSALTSLETFKTIDHYFPIRGHSFLPCDRDFAVLKRKIKRTDRIYTIEKYELLIRSSCKNNRFTVVMVHAEDVVDYKNWWSQYYKKTMLSVESGGRNTPREQKVQLKISQFMHFGHSYKNKNLVIARPFIKSVLTHTFRLNNNNRNPLKLPESLAYPDGKIAINYKKIADVRKLQSYIPDDDKIQSFYNQIFSWPTTTTPMSDDEDD